MGSNALLRIPSTALLCGQKTFLTMYQERITHLADFDSFNRLWGVTSLRAIASRSLCVGYRSKNELFAIALGSLRKNLKGDLPFSPSRIPRACKSMSICVFFSFWYASSLKRNENSHRHDGRFESRFSPIMQALAPCPKGQVVGGSADLSLATLFMDGSSNSVGKTFF